VPENTPDVRFSPAWWLSVLRKEQRARLMDEQNVHTLEKKTGLNTLHKWMINQPPLPPAAPAWGETYQAFHASTRSNLSEPLVRSATDRMTPLGFRTGASDDDNGDKLAARVWAENQMAIEQVDVLTDMLGLRYGYTMIGDPLPGSDIPVITAEDPRQVITAHDPVNRRLIKAAIKEYRDPYEEIDVCWVYIRSDDPRAKAQAYRAWKRAGSGPSTRESSGMMSWVGGNEWRWDDPIDCSTNRVPFVRFKNRRGMSEFETHIPILDRINRITLQRMLMAEIQAFRQRAVKNLPEVYPEDYPIPEMRGKAIDYEGVFTPGPGSMWMVPDGVDFWESQPIDLRPIVEMEKHEIRTFAALSGMPMYYFNPDDTNGSAEGASTQRESLVFRVQDRMTIASVGWAETMAHAFEVMEDSARADVSQIETIWAPVENLSLSEMYSAASQAKAAGLADDTIRRQVLRMTPREMQMAQDDDARQRIREARQVRAVGANVVPLPQRPGQQPPQPAPQQGQPVQPREQRATP
jgi:Phage portal protein, SPP1 Gp6-like